ncbi:hypothetical protein JKF63_07811 [Porcisia hertigi]|uniref:Uncharacterized protein n=1 Tax=Porcisia hertigi TaxID=2761500 RepID=A0A836LMD4_9TRYP|nr:hypothetical protein JKF63_07811 [Porcisia hertigi]
MLFRRLRVVHPIPLHTRRLSMRAMVVEHGVPLFLYYFITNEVLVCMVTYLLHYGYFGKEDLIGFLKSLGASKYVDLESIEGKQWSFFGGHVVLSARLVTNFTAASLFMSLWTPVQLPLCVATYPYLKRISHRFIKGKKCALPKTIKSKS